MKRGIVLALATTVLTVVPMNAQEVVELPGNDRQLNANFDEVYRVGSFDGDVWETFGRVSGVAFDALGNLFIFDGQASRFVVVDPEGNFVRDFGQEGEGPGELRVATDFTVLPDGRVVVADLGHRAYQIFGLDGDFERMVGMGGEMTVRMGGFQADRTAEAIIPLGDGSTMAMSFGPGGGADPLGTRPVERLSLSGDEVAAVTLADGWLPPQGEPPMLEGGGMRFSMSSSSHATFEPDLLVGALPDGGVAFSDSSAYEIKITGSGGGVERVIRRPFHPEPMTEEIEQAERERQLADLEAGPVGGMQMVTMGPGGSRTQIGGDAVNEMLQNQIDQMQFFSEVPVVLRLRTSWGGKIWVQRRGDEPTSDGPLDVISANGLYIGTFGATDTSMPAAFGPNGLAAFVETDEFDVPTVVVKRLPPQIN
jgi:6-bladed beta-propeller protein